MLADRRKCALVCGCCTCGIFMLCAHADAPCAPCPLPDVAAKLPSTAAALAAMAPGRHDGLTLLSAHLLWLPAQAHSLGVPACRGEGAGSGPERGERGAGSPTRRVRESAVGVSALPCSEPRCAFHIAVGTGGPAEAATGLLDH